MTDFILEPSPDEFAAWVDAAVQRLRPFLQRLPTAPHLDAEDGLAVARSLRQPFSTSGSSMPEALDVVLQAAQPGFHTAGPGYLAYIPGGGLLHAAVADLVANSLNRYVGIWAAAPGLVQLEQNVVDWFGDVVGYDRAGDVVPGGFLTSGGSLANFSGVFTARRALLSSSAELAGARLYTSQQAHHSVAKAAVLAGFDAEQVRAIDVDDAFCIDVAALRRAVDADIAEGLRPLVVIGQGGSTNTGAVDDLNALADVCAEHQMWFHVDAAYGGFFMLTSRGRARLRGLSRADSVTLDPHKGLFLPYGTGALVVKDRQKLKAAHDMSGAYLTALQSDDACVDYSQMSPELSRDFRGLRVWLPLAVVGTEAFAAQLDEKLDLAAQAADTLASWDEVEVVATPQLSVLAFRLRGQGDDVNRAWLDAVNAKGRVMLSGTYVEVRAERTFVLRLAVLSFRTHTTHVQHALEDLRQTLCDVVNQR